MQFKSLRIVARMSVAFAALSLLTFAFAQGSQQGIPWVGDGGIHETNAQIMARQALEPVLEPGVRTTMTGPEIENEREFLRQNPLSPNVSQWPVAPKSLSANGRGGPFLPQPIGVSFMAMQSSDSGFIPPDTQGDVGPTNILVCCNGRFRSFDKVGTLGALNVTANVFFTTVRNGSTVSDPRVRYDRLTGRWFVVAINVSRPNRVLIAVSDNATINVPPAGWTFYQFTQDAVGGGTSDNGALADYPTLGMDGNALYIGTNMFSTTAFLGSTGFVIRKSSILSGGPIVVTAFRQLCTGSGVGPYTPQGVDNFDAAATQGYFLGVDNVSFGLLMFRRVTNPGGAPAISANISLTVPATQSSATVPAQGSTTQIDANDDRLYMARISKNTLTGAVSLWTAHHFKVNSSGVATTTAGRLGTRWYQIQNLTTTPTLTQSGTLFDSAASNPKSFWFPSIAMNGQGHVAIGSSYAGLADFAGVATSGRLASDAAGATQAPTLAVVSSTSYTVVGGGRNRWGDYSFTNIDPTDNMTMWTVQEYCNAANSWAVRVIQLRAPVPATPASVSPASVTQSSTQNIVVTGTSVSSSGFYYGGAGFNPITASVSGTGVTVNSVTFTDPTHVTLNVTVTAGASTGARNVTITNPDGQTATGVGILTVTGPVSNPVPGVTSISPSSATAGGSGFTLTVNGSNFINGSVVNWNGSPRTTTFVNSGQVTAAISAADIATVGTRSVTVFNPAPGGGTSGALTFTVNPIEVNPSSLNLVIGTYVAGDVSSLLTSDDVRYRASTGIFSTISSTAPKVQLEVTGTGGGSSASQITVSVESQAGSTFYNQTIAAWNFTSNTWVTLRTDPMTAGDTTRTASITTNASQYLSGGQVRLRMSYPRSRRAPTTEIRLDRVHWTINP